jgi:hypothetical protein
MTGESGWPRKVESEITSGAAKQGYTEILQTITGYGATNAFQAAGDQIIYNGSAPYRLAPYPESAAELTREHLNYYPSWMLRPQFEVVPFSKRDVEFGLLKKWRDESPADIAVMLLTGQGGQGKTRFAAELARDWAADGWLPLKAFDRYDFSAPEKAEIPWGAASKGVLFVVDYAERWSMLDLLTLLRDTEQPVGIPTRVLLLARSSGQWWPTLVSRLERKLIYTASLPLSALGHAPEDRSELFSLACNGYLRKLGIDEEISLAPPPGLERDNRYCLALTIHMAALAAVLAHVYEETAPPHDPAELSGFLLRRERESWHFLYEGRQVTVQPEIMAQTVYAATLAGPLNYSDGLAVLRCAEVEPLKEHPQLLRDHALCYPPRRDDMVLEPLIPDRLGEDFIALTLPGHADPAYPADPWASDALARLLYGGNGTSRSTTPWLESAKILIADVAERWPHVAALIGTNDLLTD